MNCLVLFVMGLGIVAAAEIPEGYVLDIQPTCSKTLNGISKVHVLTDLDAHVEAECKDGHIAQFFTLNYIDWYLNTTYVGDSHYTCVSIKKNTSNAYLVYLSVSWALPGEVVLNNDIYMVTCILDDHGLAKSEVTKVKQGLLGPQEIQAHKGGHAKSEFRLQLTDIRGRALQGIVPLGRKVRLSAEMIVSNHSDAEDEIGLRAISCAAEGNGTSYKILRGGCGDGLIVPRNLGFLTKGRKVQSPIFNAFRLARSRKMKFFCNFTACASNCDGDSCVVEVDNRKKRSLMGPGELHTMMLELETRSVDDETDRLHTIDLSNFPSLRVDKSLDDTVVVDPCTISGINMKGCPDKAENQKHRDFPVFMTSLMILLMVVFPLILVIGLAAAFCCWKKESYGLEDPSKHTVT